MLDVMRGWLDKYLSDEEAVLFTILLLLVFIGEPAGTGVDRDGAGIRHAGIDYLSGQIARAQFGGGAGHVLHVPGYLLRLFSICHSPRLAPDVEFIQ